MKSVRILNNFFLLFFLFISQIVFGNDSLDKVVVVELNTDWLEYNNVYKSYFPIIKKGNHTSISQLIELENYSNDNLNFLADPDLSLFINKKLVYKNITGTTTEVKLPIKDLIFSLGNEKDVLTFFNSSGKLPYNIFFIGSASVSNFSIHSALLHFPIKRDIASNEGLYILTFLIILAIVSVLKSRYPKKYQELFRFNNIIPEIDQSIIWDLSSMPIILFVMINSFCAGLIFLVMVNKFSINLLGFLNNFNVNSVFGILLISGMFFLIYLMKYFQLRFLGWIFNLKDFVRFHFFELMKVSMKINLLLVILVLIINSSSQFEFKLEYFHFMYGFILLLLIVLFRVGYLIFTQSGFRNIYLFSYLCATEILPLIIIIKLIEY